MKEDIPLGITAITCIEIVFEEQELLADDEEEECVQFINLITFAHGDTKCFLVPLPGSLSLGSLTANLLSYRTHIQILISRVDIFSGTI